MGFVPSRRMALVAGFAEPAAAASVANGLLTPAAGSAGRHP
ncbi:hypothetical protein ACKI1I_25130 [Streptomyces turgidiscabies]